MRILRIVNQKGLQKEEFVMAEFTFNGKDLEKMFSKIERLLFDKLKICPIKYEDINNTELNYTKNNNSFIDAIKGEPAVYCIWLKRKSQKKFVPVYIGHAKDPRSRMRNHLSKKDKRTGACLEKVKNAVKSNETIGVSFVKIKPPYMRTAVEEWLIYKNSDTLLWNSHR